MDVRVIEQLLGPGVEHGREADPGLQPAAGNREQRLGRSFKEQVQGEGGSTTEEGVEGWGDGQDDVKVRHREKGLLLGLGPQGLVEGAAARAVAVAAGVIGDAGVATLVALLEMSTELSGSAGDEVADDTCLLATKAQRPRVIAQDLTDPWLTIGAFPAPVGAAHLLAVGLLVLAQPIERAGGVVEVVLGEVGVDLGRGEASVAEQGLNGTDVGAALEEVGGEGVP